MQAIKLALILSAAALPLAAQAKQPARQTAGLPQFIRSINRDAPIKSGPIHPPRHRTRQQHPD